MTDMVSIKHCTRYFWQTLVVILTTTVSMVCFVEVAPAQTVCQIIDASSDFWGLALSTAKSTTEKRLVLA